MLGLYHYDSWDGNAMSEAATSSGQEPTMEEILASIRKIISEDDEPAAAPAPVAASKPVVAPPPAPEQELDQSAVDDMFSSDVAAFDPEPEVEVEVEAPLELTQRVEPDDVGDIVAFDVDAPPAAIMKEEALVEQRTADKAFTAFNHLATNVMIATEEGVTLEDMVRSMLKPMLKDWLDRNLAQIVDEKVQDEVERLARRGRRS